MKYFLYLNSDVVNSIISQSEQGLITEMIEENGNSSEDNKNRITKVGALARLSSTFYKFFGAEAEFSVDWTKSEALSNSQVSKDIVQKTLHDAAYNIAYDYISKEIVKEEDIAVLGEYVEIIDEFQYIDFNSLLKYFSNGGFVDFLKEERYKEAQDAIGESIGSENRENRRNNKASSIKSDIKKKIDQEFNEASKLVNLLHSILPCERMYISNKGYVMPIDDRYLRDYPESFGFKYGGSMVCVGYVTNIIGKDTIVDDNSNFFESIQNSINESLRGILPLKDDNLFIINPIAIYYSNNEW